jgi:hypothetical protein
VAPEVYELVGYDDRWFLILAAILLGLLFRKRIHPPLAGVLIATGLFGLTYFIPGTEWLLKLPMPFVALLFIWIASKERHQDLRKEGKRLKGREVAWMFMLPVIFTVLFVRSELRSREEFRVQGDGVIVSGGKPGTVARSEARVLTDGDSWHLKSPKLHYPIDKDAIYIRRRKAISGAELGERLRAWAESSPTGTHTR